LVVTFYASKKQTFATGLSLKIFTIFLSLNYQWIDGFLFLCTGEVATLFLLSRKKWQYIIKIMPLSLKYRFLIKKICFLGFLVYRLLGYSQTDTEFWLSAPEVNRYHSGTTDCAIKNNGTPVYLRFTTLDKAANVTVSMPANAANFNGGAPIGLYIPANSTYTLDLTPYIRDDLVTALTSMENKLRWCTSDLAAAKPYINRNNKGILIQSDNNITAYYEIGVLYNMDLISLKGKNALGKKFFVPFQTTNQTRSYDCQYRPYHSIDIVGTTDNTKIKIVTNKDIWVRGVAGTGKKTAGTHYIWLNAGETSIITPYELHAGMDYQTPFGVGTRLTGTYIEVDEVDPSSSGGSIAVITHDDIVKSNYSLNPDYVIDQLVPIEHIGTDYAVIQGIGYSGTEIEDYIYVVGTQPSTSITVKTGPTATTNTYTIGLDAFGVGTAQAISLNNSGYRVATIKSTKPVYVFHMSGAGRQKAGALIPTISNCTGSYRVAFNRTRGGSYNFYLNILVWHTAVGKFKLWKNGVDVTATLPALNVAANYNTLPETGTPYDNWRYVRIDANALVAGSNEGYILENTENVFHLGVLNGETGSDAFYGYFSNFNQFSASASVGPSVNPEIKLCYGESTQLDADGGAKFSWSPTTFLDNPNIHNPNVITPTVTTKYTVTVYGACNLSGTADVKVNVSMPVYPSFEADTLNGCGDVTINFTNTTVAIRTA
jgi:membrane-bound inhibitor of C-type lysozyme